MEGRRLGIAERPLLVTQGDQVLDANALAAAQGVRAGDDLSRALARCANARRVEAEPSRYLAAWQALLERLLAHSPTVENARQGVAYLEARGLGALYGNEPAWCQTLLDEAAQTAGLAARLGVAGTRFAAWVAARTSPTPPSYRQVEGSDRAFLDPLPVSWLPLSDETKRRLALLGLRTLGQFAALSATAISEQFGAEHLRQHALARGEDDGPLRGYRQRVLQVDLDLEEPESRQAAVLHLLEQRARRALAETDRHPLLVQRLRLRARLFNGQELESEVWAGEALGPEALPGALARLLEGLNGKRGGIIALNLTMVGLEPAVGQQLDLFTQSAEKLRLERALAALVEKHPAGCVARIQTGPPAACVTAERYTLEALHP
jgi:protein ImuB